jgi:hypothetical protein
MEKLLWLFDIDDDRRMRARELWALLLPHAGSIISNFYKLIQSINIHPPLSDFAINRLRKKQQHWERLFHSDFGEDYARSLRRISIRHRDEELSASWYVVRYMMLKLEFDRVISESKICDQ